MRQAKKVKCLRSDNDIYRDRKFRDYYVSNNIKWEFPMSRTSQHNGVKECMNKIITKHARSMRLHVELLSSFG